MSSSEIISIAASAIAVLASPLIALWIGGILQDRKQRDQQKLAVFGTLMQSRHDQTSQEVVKALNLIDIIFSDSVEVREAWSQYYSVLNDRRLNNDPGYAVRDDRKNNLLRVMANNIAVQTGRVSTSDLLRTYHPDALYRKQLLDHYSTTMQLEDAEIEFAGRKAAREASEAAPPPPPSPAETPSRPDNTPDAP